MDDFSRNEEARGATLRRDDFLKRAAVMGAGASGVLGLLAATDKAWAGDEYLHPGEPRREHVGLRPHINRFSHITINVSDLERARAFYEATLPVKVVARTNGPAQAYPSLGLKNGRFDGYMLRDAQAYPSRAIHIVEWKNPTPVGRPYETFVHVGIYRTSNLTPDIQASYRQVIAAGGVPWGPPSNIVITPEGGGVLSFGFKDPDGTTLQYLEDPTIPEAVTYHQNIVCRSLRRSFPFYQDVLGLDYIFRRIAPEPQDASVGALGQGVTGKIYFDAPFLGYRADQRNPIDLLEWKIPGSVGRPYESPFNLGIINFSLEVDDIDKARGDLVKAGVRNVSRPETWDMGEFGTRRIVNFRDPDGVFLQLIERPPYGSETAPPFTDPF